MLPSPSNRAINKTTSIPAPVGGLNAIDSIANMPPTDADILENWFPSTTSVDVRNGYTAWQTGITGWVETIMPYNGNTTKSLFAAANGHFYDVTTKGGTPSSVASGFTSNRWIYVNVGTSGGKYIYAVNGTDSAQLYDGTSWAAVTGVTVPIALTGIATTSLSSVTLYGQRLWFIQKNSCIVWYLAAGAIGGALTSLDLTQLFVMGGTLVAAIPWTVDNVSGISQYLAFISSEGEVIVYQGFDPSSSSTFYKTAQFRIGRPIGNRPWCQVAGDVNIITADGLYPLSKALMAERDDLKDAISAKIVTKIKSDVSSYNANFGWQVILSPIGNKLIVNVPMVENSSQYQYVMNTITQAWTKFSGWNAACFEYQSDKLFFGGNGGVFQADTGATDNGSNIVTKARQAFNYLGAPGQNKIVTMVRPIFLATGDVQPSLSVNVDFKTTLPSSLPSYSSTGSPWGTSPWNTSPWSSSEDIQADWQTVGGIGKAVTIYIGTASQGQSVKWQATDYLYQIGGIL